MLRVLIIALVLLVAAMFMLPRPGPQVATMLDAPRELPAVTLIDQDTIRYEATMTDPEPA